MKTIQTSEPLVSSSRQLGCWDNRLLDSCISKNIRADFKILEWISLRKKQQKRSALSSDQWGGINILRFRSVQMYCWCALSPFNTITCEQINSSLVQSYLGLTLSVSCCCWPYSTHGGQQKVFALKKKPLQQYDATCTEIKQFSINETHNAQCIVYYNYF